MLGRIYPARKQLLVYKTVTKAALIGKERGANRTDTSPQGRVFS